MVYVPTQRVRPGDAEANVELRHLQDGQLALLAYSTLDRLVDCCGEFQPWALLPSVHVEELRQTTGFDVIVIDTPIPAELQHGPGGTGE